jgi:hypothetical protein
MFWTAARGGVVNARWHASHVMPRPATLEARVNWHVAHAWHCGCRAVPATVAAELTRRGLSVPVRRPTVRVARKKHS